MMKKVIVMLACAALTVSTACAVVSVSQSAGYAVEDGARNHALENIVVTDVPAIITAINQLLQPQEDTNTVSDSTLFTPRRTNDTLIGTVSNIIYKSVGETTNDWVRTDD